MQKRSGVPLIVIGIILILMGMGLWIGGGVVDGNVERHLESIFNYGHRNSSGTVMIYAGIGVIVIGAILSLIGIIMYATSGKADAYTNRGAYSDNGYTQYVDRYVSPDGLYSVEFDTNGGCVWTQQGKRYRAFYRKINDWEWVIAIDGFGDAFTFTKRDNGIFVIGGPVSEIFYRDNGAARREYPLEQQGFPGSYHRENTPPATYSAHGNTETKECLSCGARNRTDADVCDKCGGFYFRQNKL